MDYHHNIICPKFKYKNDDSKIGNWVLKSKYCIFRTKH